MSHVPHSGQLVPGNYFISHKAPNGFASVYEGVELDSTQVTDLHPGTAVHVVEVVTRNDLRRVRGRIDKPVAGWISLEALGTACRWARPGLI